MLSFAALSWLHFNGVWGMRSGTKVASGNFPFDHELVAEWEATGGCLARILVSREAYRNAIEILQAVA